MFFEKLIVTRFVKRYPAFFMEPEKDKRQPLDPILSHTNPVHPIDPYLRKVHLNVIFPPFPSGLPTKTLQTPLPSSMCTTCPAHLILLDLITPRILGEEYR
jgi:hypothetical protein